MPVLLRGHQVKVLEVKPEDEAAILEVLNKALDIIDERLVSPGRKPRDSPASTAGLVRTIRSMFSFFSCKPEDEAAILEVLNKALDIIDERLELSTADMRGRR